MVLSCLFIAAASTSGRKNLHSASDDAFPLDSDSHPNTPQPSSSVKSPEETTVKNHRPRGGHVD